MYDRRSVAESRCGEDSEQGAEQWRFASDLAVRRRIEGGSFPLARRVISARMRDIPLRIGSGSCEILPKCSSKAAVGMFVEQGLQQQSGRG